MTYRKRTAYSQKLKNMREAKERKRAVGWNNGLAYTFSTEKIMNDTEIINLAIDCGALIEQYPEDAKTTLVTFTLDEIKEFISHLPPPKVETTVVGGGG